MAPLPSLPPELLLLIADKLPTRDISVLSRTSQNIHTLLTPLLERRFTAEATSILCWAVPRKRIALIKRALSNGADLTCQSYEEPWTRGIPLLALTVINSDIPVTKLLLEAGADINQTHPYLFNDPPVIYAYNLNDNNMVRLLQRYGGRLPQPDPSEYFILRDSWGFGIV